jgi:hypothetical protein
VSGTIGEGVQYRLKVDSTREYMYRHHIVTYTGTDEGIDLHDASAGASFIFAGVIYTSWPYQEQAALYGSTSPYAGTNVSVPPADEFLTVARNSRNHVIAAETIAAGNLIMPTDVIDHVTLLLETHDGMVSPVATGTSTEVDQAIGFAEKGFTVPATNDVHLANWDWDYGDYRTVHQAVWAYIFK